MENENHKNGYTNTDLYERQKAMLDTLLAHGAITQAQHDYSLGCLTEKMAEYVKPDAKKEK